MAGEAIKAQDHRDASDHISDFERAICYYTLPRVTTPFTLALVVAYLVCLLEALAALAIGFFLGNVTWTRVGVAASTGIIVLGVIIFFARAILNEIRQRKALAVAEGVPDASDDVDDLPDPFANHMLLRYSRVDTEVVFEVTNSQGNLEYRVEGGGRRHTWKVRDPRDEEIFTVRATRGLSSFSLEKGLPNDLVVFEGDEETAHIARRFSWTVPRIDVACRKPQEDSFVIRRNSIFHDDRLVGRIYFLRGFIYLDVESAWFHNALLAYFVAIA